MSTKRKIMIGLISFLTLIAYSRFAVSSKKPSKEIVDSVIKRLPSDANYLCIVNFGKHSGEERFFIYNVRNKSTSIVDWCNMEMAKVIPPGSLSSAT